MKNTSHLNKCFNGIKDTISFDFLNIGYYTVNMYILKLTKTKLLN